MPLSPNPTLTRTRGAHELRFTLIVASLGREEEVRVLLDSLRSQSYRQFEVVIIDQNSDRRLEPVAADYASALDLIYSTSAPGLSHSRNRGLDRATGDIVAFPDDDCRYPPNLLASVASWFEGHPDYSLLSGRTVDETGRATAARFDTSAGAITRRNVFRRANSASMFIRWSEPLRTLRFDESLGLGSGTPWGSGEDTDLPLRAMALGVTAWYEPGLHVHHPPVDRSSGQQAFSRAYSYGCGTGRVMRLHSFPLDSKLRILVRPLMGALEWGLRGNMNRARYHLAVLRGRARGLGLTTCRDDPKGTEW